MVPFPPSVSARSRVVLGTLPLLIGSLLWAQEPEGEAVSEIPNRFFQTQDSGGYFWQPAGNGALTSGDTQYLQSGLNWLIDGVAFAPSKALVRAPDEFPGNSGVFLEEFRDSLVLRRDLWIDRERGGVRSLDTIVNRGTNAASVEVVLRTTYPFAWQSLHGIDGELLSKDPVLSLGDEDFGMVVHCSAAEGRHDTFFVVASETGSIRPRVSASSNRRELSFSYRLDVPAGGSQSLLHWISQKSIPDLSLVPEVFVPFYHRKTLVDPGLMPSQRPGISNFAASAIPGEADIPGTLETLLSLNSFLDRTGLERRFEDFHWISPVNEISGKVRQTSPLMIQSSVLGELEIPLGELAAIRGGPGGRSYFYLRNGEVLSGTVVGGGLEVTPTGGTVATELNLDTMGVLLLAIEEIDGKPRGGATRFLETLDQSVFAVDPESDAGLVLATPWGTRAFPFPSIREIAHVSEPFPAYRILTQEGSRFSAFLIGNELRFPDYRGRGLELPLHGLHRIWSIGAREFSLEEIGTPWLSMEEVPGGESGGFLLQGNAFLRGEIPESTLQISDNGSVISLESGMIQSITRDFDREAESERAVIVELASGETLRGDLQGSFLPARWEGEELKIPLESFIAYRVSTS